MNIETKIQLAKDEIVGSMVPGKKWEERRTHGHRYVTIGQRQTPDNRSHPRPISRFSPAFNHLCTFLIVSALSWAVGLYFSRPSIFEGYPGGCETLL